MPWNGYQDDASDVGDGWDQMENCSFFIKEQCRRRLGFGARIDLTAAVVRSAGELGSRCLVATAAGAILSILESTGAVSSLATGLDTTNWGSFAPGNNRLYYTNGVDALRVSDNGTAIRTAGITTPATAATASATGSGGVVAAGVHLIRYRYYDSALNRLSDPSASVSVTIAAGEKISAGHTTNADTSVDKIIIEMTAVGASAYYRVATVTKATASTTIDVSDANLILGVAASRDGEFQHQPPPVVSVVLEHRQRLWGLTTTMLYWSRALFPESWDSINYSRAITMDAGDVPTALASFYSDLYVFGSRSMRRLVYTSDPAAAMILDVPGNFGAFNQRCVLKIDGGLLIGWGRNGAWMIDSMQPKKISKQMDETIASLSSATNLTQRFICYEPIRREVHFVFPLDGETTCKAAAIWSLDTGEWTLTKWRQGITAACQNTQYLDRQRLAIFDANGFGWRVGVLKNDGVDNGHVVCGAGSSTTIINGTNTAVVGCMLYRPATGEERVITACTAGQMTVAAMATAPGTGEIVYVGSIRRRLLTDWNIGKGADDKKRPTKLQIAMRPDGTMGSGTVAYYHDFSATAVTVTSNAADAFPSGVSIATGGNTIAVDFDAGGQDGYIPVPMPSDWKRAIRVEIILEDPQDDVVLLDAAMRQDSSLSAAEE